MANWRTRIDGRKEVLNCARHDTAVIGFKNLNANDNVALNEVRLAA